MPQQHITLSPSVPTSSSASALVSVRVSVSLLLNRKPVTQPLSSLDLDLEIVHMGFVKLMCECVMCDLALNQNLICHLELKQKTSTSNVMFYTKTLCLSYLHFHLGRFQTYFFIFYLSIKPFRIMHQTIY